MCGCRTLGHLLAEAQNGCSLRCLSVIIAGFWRRFGGVFGWFFGLEQNCVFFLMILWSESGRAEFERRAFFGVRGCENTFSRGRVSVDVMLICVCFCYSLGSNFHYF